jgi:hypothetical protein
MILHSSHPHRGFELLESMKLPLILFPWISPQAGNLLGSHCVELLHRYDLALTNHAIIFRQHVSHIIISTVLFSSFPHFSGAGSMTHSASIIPPTRRNRITLLRIFGQRMNFCGSRSTRMLWIKMLSSSSCNRR